MKNWAMKSFWLVFMGNMLLLNGAEKIKNKDPLNLGVPYPLHEESTWRSKLMAYPEKSQKKDFHESGTDFFKDEYGKPCVFSEDWIKEHGYSSGKYTIKNGALVFDTGKKGFSFAFGPSPDQPEIAGPRLGSNWGGCEKDVFRLEMRVQQNVPKTEWLFQIRKGSGYGRSKKFVVDGTKPQIFMTDLGLVRTLNSDETGVKFTCLTPGATVKIKSLKIAPYSSNVYFRRKVDLPWKPVMAHATFDAPEDYDIYVNGQKVASGNKHYFHGTVKSVDLKPYLKKGKNLIAIRKSWLSWLNKKPVVLFEAFAAGRDGQIERILGGKGWKTSLSATDGWQTLSFDDSRWKNSKALPGGMNFITELKTHTGKPVFMGVNPKHMGVMDAKPSDGRKHPIFEYSEKTISYTLKIPAALKGKSVPELKLIDADSDKIVENIKGKLKEEGNGFAVYEFFIATRNPGPYVLNCQLKGTKAEVLEERKDEMVIVGPIKQDNVALENFEKEFEKRLKLVQQIDCSQKVNDDKMFVDHSGMYSPPTPNKGRVVERDGIKYRETGRGMWDWFAYRAKKMEFGKPYLVEIVVPDNASRYIMSGLMETFPIRFRNNPKDRGQWSATAACYTGGKYPLSGKTKTLRYICWPASHKSAIVVVSGYRNNPAAACRINIYKIEGGLPALAIPKTERLFGSFNERISVMIATTGRTENSLFDNMTYHNGNIKGWHSWYKAIERKITWLRFQGRNMTGEGVYMYNKGDYPSLKHNKEISNQELDPIFLAIKMYAQNNIKCMLGVEFQCSPDLEVSEDFKVSDRKMQHGADTLFMVDKNGFQINRRASQGVNFLHPKVSEAYYGTISEIYDFYKDTGPVAGMFMITGKYWLPTFFPSIKPGLGVYDIGYGDLTVSLFEKDTGTKLNIDLKDPKRFQKRYNLLTKKYKKLWLAWRAAKVREATEKVSKIITQGKNKWRLYLVPYFLIDHDNPFIESSGTKQQRDKFLDKSLFEAAYPSGRYTDNPYLTLVTRMLRRYRFATPEEKTDYIEAWNSNSRKLIKNSDAIYFFDRGLPMFFDEIDCPAKAAKNWIWDHSSRGIFVAQGVEDNAMEPFVNAVIDPVPNTIMYAQIDCNMETAHGRQIRRFCKSFYATPKLQFSMLSPESAKGVIAEIAIENNNTYLRLINNSPWPSKGWFKASANKVRDLVYDRYISSCFLSGGKHEVEMKPYDIRVFKLQNSNGKIKCNFALPQNAAQEIMGKAEYILKDKKFLEQIPGDIVAGMIYALNDKDAFALRELMDDFEVKNATGEVEGNRIFLKNQKKLLEDLNKSRARIICASKSEYIAPDGSRWLSDQKYSDCGAYGNEGATFTDRGQELDIKNTDIDRVYQTEAYGGKIVYKIPIPEGKYNIYIHFAETFIKNKRPGLRQISVKAENVRHPELIDPFAMAGGWAKPYVLKMKDVLVLDGELDIELSGGVGVNGIEIEKVK
jgi:malectin (di-glucose binding ER protein)